jgi:osmoprotectant transport system ATP-binding protein
MVNRLVEPVAGQVLIDGEDVARADPVQLRRRIGYVIQQVGLFPHQTVADNVATVPRLLRWPEARVRARVDELIALVGLEPTRVRGRYPAQLSGGERQRIGVARALAAEPPLLLMDEPFGAVDPVVRARLQDEFLRLQRLLGTTVLFVTHYIDEAIRLGTHVAVFRTGGRLAQYATPDELLARPADDYVATFVGADRALKRLSLRTLEDVALAPLEAGAIPQLNLPVETDLRAALSALLAVRDGRAAVVRGGATVGVVELDAITSWVARSDAETARDEPLPYGRAPTSAAGTSRQSTGQGRQAERDA